MVDLLAKRSDGSSEADEPKPKPTKGKRRAEGEDQSDIADLDKGDDFDKPN